MDDSILTSIKKLLGIDKSYDAFDKDVIFHINTVLSELIQIGVGPNNGYCISSEEERWSDYLGEDNSGQQMVISYIYLKVKLLFDPPASSVAVQAIKDQISEIEWRLSVTNTDK